MKNPSPQTIAQAQRVVFYACLLPFARLLACGLAGRLGPDPVADITHSSGAWALRLLLLALAITPAKQLTGWHWLARLRRTIALYAFFYATLHLASYLVFEQFFDWREIGKDITKRPYISAGLTAYGLMIPLAATSTQAMMKRLGGRNWQTLHRLSYLAALAAVLHYFWLVKRDTGAPALYALILATLLCARLARRRCKPAPAPVKQAPPRPHQTQRVHPDETPFHADTITHHGRQPAARRTRANHLQPKLRRRP